MVGGGSPGAASGGRGRPAAPSCALARHAGLALGGQRRKCMCLPHLSVMPGVPEAPCSSSCHKRNNNMGGWWPGAAGKLLQAFKNNCLCALGVLWAWRLSKRQCVPVTTASLQNQWQSQQQQQLGPLTWARAAAEQAHTQGKHSAFARAFVLACHPACVRRLFSGLVFQSRFSPLFSVVYLCATSAALRH